MGKVLVSASHFDTLCTRAWNLLQDSGHTVIYDPERKFPAYSHEELLYVLKDADAAIIGMDQYDAGVFDAAPNLKVVAKFGVGVDNIDLAAATAHGVKVVNAPGQNSNAVAELTIGMMIDLLRGVLPLQKQMEQGNWPRQLGSELKGKTVGLVGFGAIARLVAKKLSCFDVTVQACDLYMNDQLAAELNVQVKTMEEVLTTSHIVSLHIPATEQTYHLIDRKMIAKMRDGVYLLNPARGALVDIDAVCDGLQSGKIAGAAFDAYEQEPLPQNARILQSGNVICMPHIGAETREAYDNVSLCVAQNIVDALEGREPRCWVNRW